MDEGFYLVAGALLWAHGDLQANCGAPALPKWGFAAAMRAVEPRVAAVPTDWLGAARALLIDRTTPEIRRVLVAARAATVIVTVLGGLLLWVVALRFGARVAFVTHLLWCCSPTVLANGALATLDGWTAVLGCVVLWAAVRVVERPSTARVGALGAALAGAAATKITTLGMAPVAGAVAVWAVARRAESPRAVAARLAAPALAAAGGFVLALFAVYGFSIGSVNVADPCPGRPPTAVRLVGPLPFPAWIEGLWVQLHHGRTGHASYLFGEVRETGWWWFYLACLALKTTLGAQGIALVRAAAALVARRRPLPSWAVDAALLAYPALLLVQLSLGRHQANVAFLLPAFPCMLVWLGRGVLAAEHAFGAAGRRLVVALAVAGAVESLAVHPHHLMFFNAWAGGPDGGARYLVHREDWGQDKRRLAAWQRARGVPRLYYAPYGPLWEQWGIVADPVPCEPRVGVYALHAVEVHRPRFALAPGCVDWLTVEPPDERLGHSIYLYTVDAERLERLRATRDTPTPFWRSGARASTKAP